MIISSSLLLISCIKAVPKENIQKPKRIIQAKPVMKTFENFDFGLFFTLLTPSAVVQDQLGSPDIITYKNKGTDDEKAIWVYKVENSINWTFIFNNKNKLLYAFEITPKPPRKIKVPLIYPGKLMSKVNNDDIHALFGEPVSYTERKDKPNCFSSEYQYTMKSFDRILKCFVFIDYDKDYKIEKVYVGVKTITDRK